MVDYPLDENIQLKLDGSGNGIARLTPFGARNSGLSWNLQGATCSVATNTSEAQAACYVSYGIQSQDPTNLQGVSQQGSTGDTCTVSAVLRPGDWITMVWTGGDANAIATMRVFGTVTPPGVS